MLGLAAAVVPVVEGVGDGAPVLLELTMVSIIFEALACELLLPPEGTILGAKVGLFWLLLGGKISSTPNGIFPSSTSVSVQVNSSGCME